VPGILLYVSLFYILPSQAASTTQSRFFGPTGYTLSGSFLTFFDSHGGLRIFGYPISDRGTENGRPVQYFERQRFEYHAEAAGTPNEVQLSRLGTDLAPVGAISQVSVPFASMASKIYVPETRHSLSNAFLDFWQANGDVRVLGYPITEPLTQDGLLVQYFERARLEYHPEKASVGYAVELGGLGKQYLRAHPEIVARLAAASRAAAPDSRGGDVPSQPQASTALVLSGEETDLLQRINDVRKAEGAATVSLDRTLKDIALSRSTDMVARNYFSHTTPDGQDFLSILKAAGVPFKFAGEIITNNNYSDQDTASQAFSSFMNSPHHREILLDPRYNIAGVGEYTNSAGFNYFTVLFVQN
jgi:uncharacterized protein YkwD